MISSTKTFALAVMVSAIALSVHAADGTMTRGAERPPYLLAAATSSAAVIGPTVIVSVCQAMKVRNSRPA